MTRYGGPRRSVTQRAAERRQNLAQGEANEASGTLGCVRKTNQARFSGRQNVCLLLIFFVFLFAACSRNDGGGISSSSGGWPPNASNPLPVSSSAQVVKFTATSVRIDAGGSADAIVGLTISPGYHVNANPATFSYLIATELTAGKTDGLHTSTPIYPAAAKRKFQFEEEPLAVFEGAIEIKLPLAAEEKAAKGVRELPIHLRIQACDDEKCYPPATIDTNVRVVVNSPIDEGMKVRRLKS